MHLLLRATHVLSLIFTLLTQPGTAQPSMWHVHPACKHSLTRPPEYVRSVCICVCLCGRCSMMETSLVHLQMLWRGWGWDEHLALLYFSLLVSSHASTNHSSSSLWSTTVWNKSKNWMDFAAFYSDALLFKPGLAVLEQLLFTFAWQQKPFPTFVTAKFNKHCLSGFITTYWLSLWNHNNFFMGSIISQLHNNSLQDFV